MNTKKTTEEVAHLARVLDLQVRRDFAPVWNRYGTVFAASETDKLPEKTWKIYLFDQPRTREELGAYGYHETRGNAYVPVGFVFTGLCDRNHEPWSGVTSHEVLEALGDPWINVEVRRTLADGSSELWPYEVADAPQGQYYSIDGMQVANFLLPEYFIDGADGPFDFLGRLKAPFSIAETGYSAVTHISKDGKATTTDRYGVHYPAWRKEERPGSRKAARYKGVYQ